MRTDVYQKITDQIVSELEKGVRPWMKPWNAEHAAGRITRPLRGNGIPYQGSNVEGIRRADLDDLQAGAGIQSLRPQGRARESCRVRRQDHPHRDGCR